jgi:cell division protein FtsQ
MARGRTERGSRRRPRAASAVVPLPRHGPGDRLDLARVVPSGRSLVVGFALVAAVLGAYWGARESSVFAVERVEIVGAPPSVARQVKALTAATVGTSLLEVDAQRLEDRLRALPSIAGASVDRAFPHSLVVKVAAERPVAVVRRGSRSWLATGGGRMIMEIDPATQPKLPRLWIPRGVAVSTGGALPSSLTNATRALAAVQEAGLSARVKGVRPRAGQLTLVLRSGLEVRLGAAVDLLLKVTVARRVLPLVETGTAYLDVSVPERPVAGSDLNSQVEP